MKRTIIRLSLLVTAASLSIYCSAQSKSRTRPVIPYEHAKISAPPGMVYVPGGTTIIKYSTQATDSNCVKKVSLSSFFIDKTEVTNQQYRQFVEWVMDSIAITKYLGEDKYFKDAKEVDSAGNEVATVRRINWARVDHKDIFENQEYKSKLRPMFDEKGHINKDSVMFAFTYLRASGTNPKLKVGTYATESVAVYPDEEIWAKDLPNAQTDILVENYFTSAPYDDYPVVGVTWKQARAFTYWRSVSNNTFGDIPDYLKSYHFAFSLPTEAQWVYAAQQDVKAYTKSLTAAAEDADGGKKGKKAKKDEPAKDEVAATSTKEEKGKKAKKDVAPVVTDSTSVPTPDAVADQPATDGGASTSWNGSTTAAVEGTANAEDTLSFFDPVLPEDKTPIASDKKGLTANFKQDEGEYTADGSAFTVPVMSYAPNDFGIYNMIGNVAEWTMDAYSPAAFAFVSDVNPQLLYDADSTDTKPMKRKVCRGGSFLSNAKSLSPYARDYELQDAAHCYIGFRCVMGAPDVLTAATATRKKNKKK